MGNVTSSLNIGTLESIANTVQQAAADPSAVFNSLNSHSYTLASSVSDTFKDARQDPSAVLHTLDKRGQNVIASLLVTAKEFRSSELVADFPSVFRKNWYEAVARLPIYRRDLMIVFS
ncbi:hypothetical protein BGZ60DRAFT_65331 [Tricladium varicosporioides]|nr:hypothetical protein BGZ60DRAFT_65331 [Hymenoscyphus varicosporioides]